MVQLVMCSSDESKTGVCCRAGRRSNCTEIYDSFLKEQETSEEENSSYEESSEEQTSPSTSQESQAQTQTQSQTPSSSQEESQIKDVVLGIEDYSMLFGLGLAGAGGMLLIWLALKFKRI